MDKLTDSELQILREINGDLPPSPWGAWVGACYEALTGGGYITREGITVRGTQALLDAASSTLTADTGDGQSAADTRQIISEGEFRTDNGTSWATDWIGIAQEGFENWKAKPHNARWFRKIDGTPIPNDLTICIGEAFASRLRTLSAQLAEAFALAYSPDPFDPSKRGPSYKDCEKAALELAREDALASNERERALNARATASESEAAALRERVGVLEGRGTWQPISALWSRPAECSKGCPPRQVCDFCQRELFLGWNGDYVELWNTTNYYTCRERSEPPWKHMAEEAARLTHFMAFDMPDRARTALEGRKDG